MLSWGQGAHGVVRPGRGSTVPAPVSDDHVHARRGPRACHGVRYAYAVRTQCVRSAPNGQHKEAADSKAPHGLRVGGGGGSIVLASSTLGLIRPQRPRALHLNQARGGWQPHAAMPLELAAERIRIDNVNTTLVDNAPNHNEIDVSNAAQFLA